jgi:hypothetical protein
MQGIVHTLGSDADNARNHDSVTRAAIARRLARLKGYRFDGEFVPERQPPAHRYFVPADTLVGVARAASLGIRCEEDLFGAVVPYAFVATKTITHPSVGAHARAPDGWTHAFAERVAGSVLDGYSAFSRHDAEQAARLLLERGPIRVKCARGIGGRGQWVAREPADIARILRELDTDDLESAGVVVEEHLSDVRTYSVGQVRVAGIVASYWGTQRLTSNNVGHEVYGGSELHLVRGGFDRLLAQPIERDVRTAVTQGCDYDAAAFSCHPQMFASRRNYDVAQGIDGAGRTRSGVLEQSWRIGGATPGEILALEALAADPSLDAVCASTVEIYGACDAPPADATVFFRGEDARVGAITKYAKIDTHAHAR